MTHPEALLADYVDGTLDERERAVVDAHLETCAGCREEVELARGAVTALASLLEVPVPLGVTGPVLAEAGARSERRRSAAWQRLQWVAGAAAAAALVAVVVLGGGIGREDAGDETARDGGAAAEAGGVPAPATLQAASPALERQADVNYDEDGVTSLAEEAVARERSLGEGATGATAGAEATGAIGEAAADLAASPDPALRCLRRSGAPLDDTNYVLTRLIEAKFERTPAYIALFLQSPGAGQPPDHAVVWVVARDDCRILNLQSLPI
jgi:anti-sigma factor RsiW